MTWISRAPEAAGALADDLAAIIAHSASAIDHWAAPAHGPDPTVGQGADAGLAAGRSTVAAVWSTTVPYGRAQAPAR
jgi:hypothetical protein